MAYPKGAYENHDRLPVPERPQWGPARKINFNTKRYVIKANGSLDHMPPIAQRVVILVLKNEINPETNTLVNRNQWAQGVRNTLSPLERETPPAIRLISVSAEPNGVDGVTKTVIFKDLGTQASEPPIEVQIP